MSPYKLKELRNTEQHEQAIMQHVKQNLYKKSKKKYVLAPILAGLVTVAALLFVLVQLNNNSTTNVQTASDYMLLNVFQQVDGHGVASSEQFKEYDQQDIRQLTYFKPVPLATFTNANNVKLPKIIPPFDKAKAEVLAVNDGMQTELQFTFSTGDSNNPNKEFIIISAAKHFMNPLNSVDIENLEKDPVGNVVVNESLNETTPLIHQIISTNSSLVYKYFTYDTDANKINVTAGRSTNELYTYYNGIIYHVGYQVEGDMNEVVSYVKEFILTSNLHELDLEQNTMGDREHAKGGRSIVIAAGILLIAIAVASFLSKGTTMKLKQIIWGITIMLAIAPLLSWLIGISYGVYEGEGFAAMGVMVILFPILFIIGLVVFLIGLVKLLIEIFKKEDKGI